MRFLIAPWGNYKKWDEVEYRTEDGKVSLTSCTSFLLLHEIFKPDRAIVFVPDTLYEILTQEVPNDYGEIHSKVEFETQMYLKNQGINADVFVLPAVWKKEFSFEGAMTDFYYSAFKIFVDRILEDILKDERIEIILDLTHGVNFMPVLIYEALKQIGSVLALVKDIELITFNAEPWIKGISSLQVYKIRSERLKPSFDYYLLSKNNKILKPRENLDGNEKTKIGRSIANIIKKLDMPAKTTLDAFMISVMSNFPLGVLTFFPDIELLENFVESACNMYRKSIEVDGKRVLRKLEFSTGFESLLKLKLVSRLLSSQGIRKEKEVKIDLLENLVSIIGKDQARRILALNEISNIRQKLKKENIRSNGWIELSWIFKEYNRTSKEVNPDKRIFIAHAGLEMLLVEVKPNLGLIRYKADRIDEIKQTIINTFVS